MSEPKVCPDCMEKRNQKVEMVESRPPWAGGSLIQECSVCKKSIVVPQPARTVPAVSTDDQQPAPVPATETAPTPIPSATPASAGVSESSISRLQTTMGTVLEVLQDIAETQRAILDATVKNQKPARKRSKKVTAIPASKETQ